MKAALPTSADIKRIFFKQQRKKNILPEHAVLTNELNDVVRDLRGRLALLDEGNSKERLNAELRRVLEQKKVIEESYFEQQAENVTDYILKQPSTIRLSKSTYEGREVTTLNKRRPTITLFDRFVSQTLASSYRIRSRGRDHIIQNVLNALRMTVGSKEATRSIVKIDIREFFKTIDHELLQRKLSSHSGVPQFALRHVDAILDAYERIYRRKSGIPQGVPSSSMLSEIYMESLDDRLKQHPNVILYVRYVDDILIISDGDSAELIVHYVDELLSRLNLSRNESKSVIISHSENAARAISRFDYLGYQFRFSADTRQLETIDISHAKLTRYLTAVERLRSFAQNSLCWNDEQSVRKFLDAYEYLVFPHYSSGDADSLRIVSGLAYSAKYIIDSERPGANIKTFVDRINGTIGRMVSSVICGAPNSIVCGCCQKPVAKVEKLRRYFGVPCSYEDIMKSPAMPHLDDTTRRESRRLLWNS